MKTVKGWKKAGLLPLVLAAIAVVVLQVIPALAEEPEYSITEGVPEDIEIGTDTNEPTRMGFGGKKWDAIGYQGDGVYSQADTVTLLLADGYNFTAGVTRFSDNNSNEYSTSLLKKEMEEAYSSLKDVKEKEVIEPRDLAGGSGNYDGGSGNSGYDSDKIAGDPVEGAKFWPLSVGEAEELNPEVRQFIASGANGGSGWWWLRSPGNYDFDAAYVHLTGSVYPGGIHVNSHDGIRPAFRLNLESVILTSAAAGGKSATAGSGLSGTKVPVAADTLKFTIQDDDNQKLKVTGVTNISNGTGELQFHYTKATTGENQYISCVLVKGEGNSSTVEYYGKLADLEDESSQNGTVTISLDGVDAGDYTLKLFSEQDNGEYNTDYAGSIHEYPLKVASGKGTIDGGLGSDNSQKVYYGHNGMVNWDGSQADSSESPMAWRIMKNSSQVLTLLSDQLLGDRAYHLDWQEGHKDWSGSDIAQYLNEDFLNSSFDHREANQVESYGETETTNGHTGIDISQKIVLPSYEEVYGDGGWIKNNSERIASYADTVETASGAGWWWLRSPGDFGTRAACVLDAGSVIPGGIDVNDYYGIRPVFRLNLESVILISAAEGGKSATAGSHLVGTVVPTGDIKLTLLEDTVTAPVITMESEDAAKVLEFQYSGSKPDGYQYISCILTDEAGEEVFYYGKLAEPVADQGDFQIEFQDIPEGTYTLKIFWEECHGDYETDYASQPVKRKLTVSGDGRGKVEDLVPPAVEEIKPEEEADEVPVSGEIKIIFDEAMNTETAGTVKLVKDGETNGVTLSGEGWSGEDCVYTLSYDRLEYNTIYHVEVSGFWDQTGNEMAEPFTSRFTTDGSFAGGDGTEGNPCLISTAEHLDAVRNYLGSIHSDKHFKLINDIDLTDYLADGGEGYKKWEEKGWEPIGKYSNEFYGQFDGNENVIKGLWIDRENTDEIGLFGCTNGGTIKNLSIVIPSGRSVTGKNYVGGLIGENTGGIVSGCCVTGTVNGNTSIGLLIGSNNGGTIEQSYSIGVVTGTGNSIGGLVGFELGGSITDSYAHTSVSGSGDNIGGLAGQAVNAAKVKNSYATGAVKSEGQDVGGLIGKGSENSTITSSFYDSQTTGQDDNGKGTSKATEEMQAEDTFTGWDFANVWGIYEGCGYPYLKHFGNDILITPSVTPDNSVYDSEIPSPLLTYAVSENYDSANKPLTGNPELELNADAGEYKVTQGSLTGSGYQITFKNDVIYTITKAQTSIDITGDFENLTRDGKLEADITVEHCYNKNDTISYTFGTINETAVLEDGKATIEIDLSQVKAGTHTLSVRYAGDDNHNNSTGQQKEIYIGRAMGKNSYTFPMVDAPVTYDPNKSLADVQLSNGTGNGTFAWKDGSTKPTVDKEEYDVVFTPNDTDDVDYSNEEDGYAETGGIVTITRPVKLEITPAASSVAIMADKNDINYGDPVTFTATVKGVSDEEVPGGEVQFSINGEEHGAPVTVENDGTASVTVSDLKAGTYTVTAQYSGEINYNGSSRVLQDFKVNAISVSTVIFPLAEPDQVSYDPTKTLESIGLTGGDANGTFVWQKPDTVPTVEQRAYPVVFTPNDLDNFNYLAVEDWNPETKTITRMVQLEITSANTSVVVTADKDGISYGDSVRFTATVKGVSDQEAPAGTVQFSVDGEVYGEPVEVKADGTAAVSLADLKAGVHIITAAYSGAANYTSAAGSYDNFEVSQRKAELRFPEFDQAVTYHPARTLSEIALTNGSGNGRFAWQDGSIKPTVDVSAYEVVFTPDDTDNYDYSGEDNWNGEAVTRVVELTITPANSSVEITADQTSVDYGGTVTFTAVVKGVDATEYPAGEVEFFVNGTSAGKKFLSGGTAAVTLTDLKAGTYAITAAYSGETNYQGSNGVLQDFKVNPATASAVTFPAAEPGEVIYDPSQTLERIGLTGSAANGTFAWQKPDTVPTVDVGSYPVVFIPDDAENYDYSDEEDWDADTKTITRLVALRVNQADPSVEIPSGVTGIYGDTLGMAALPEGWSWDNSLERLGRPGSYEYPASYIPADSINYRIVQKMVPVTVQKRAITISAKDVTVEFGGDIPALTWSITGGTLVNGDEIIVGTLKTDADIDTLGQYEITEETPFHHECYEITFRKGMFTVISNEAMQTVIDTVNALADPIKTREQADAAANAANLYQALTEAERNAIAGLTAEKLETAQKQSGAVNHADGDISIAGLPWYVRVMAENISDIAGVWKDTLGKLEEKDLLVLYDIKLVNTLDNSGYSLAEEETVKVTMNGIDMKNRENVIAFHVNKDGQLDEMPAEVSGTSITFTADSFSLYGAAAQASVAGEPEPPADPTPTPSPEPGGAGDGKPNGTGSKGERQKAEKPGAGVNTGDRVQSWIWWLLLLAGALGTTGAIRTKRKNRG